MFAQKINYQNKPTLGAAMIVKDADETVSKAINSVLPVCRQIVVVDTGSTDNTPSICSRLGAEVYFFRWTGSFSEARNYALNFMRTDWILALDADEELVLDSFIENALFLEDNSAGGLTVIIKNLLGERQSNSVAEHRYTRIFRRNKNFRYEGKIHEQISSSIIESGMGILNSNIIIKHYGYAAKSEEKIKRNKELLNEELREKPHDDWLKYHLAETEFAAGNYNESKTIFESVAYSALLTDEQRHKTALRLAQMALMNENYAELRRRLDFHSSDVNIEGLRKFILATDFLLQRNYTEAAKILNSHEIQLSELVDKTNVQRALEVIKQVNGMKR